MGAGDRWVHLTDGCWRGCLDSGDGSHVDGHGEMRLVQVSSRYGPTLRTVGSTLDDVNRHKI